jgi:signal transduction histidine kinase
MPPCCNQTRFLTVAHAEGRVKETGNLAGILLLLVFVTATRNSPLTFLLGLPYERQIWWHKFFGTIAAFSTTVHVSELQNKSSEKQERELKREKREKRERERERIQERKSYWGN